ncbi:50S ribosomal protein L5 [archaeon]|jgi:large subunit ribosomal protein L5|nr:50S ribosomal protein L5 [archaeon]MBT4272468.1 50S ribosomal protein L5 [archaeon]MBT4460566.1 50S ribosomal protein L5 [archaeon]MBT4857844.1 50S ribosomal protein L5 [archaeon]MBT5423141.1 50S ribosomal protein L5 [archaeon]
MNQMKQIRIEKLTLNVGAGTNQDLLKKGMKLLKNITGVEPVKTISEKRIPSWGVRPGLPVGCKITIRGSKVEEIIPNLLKAKDNLIKKSCFDSNGNLSFGIHEYIDVPNLNYDSEIGIIGFQISVTLTRPGYRIKNRKKLTRKVGKTHKISQEEGIKYFEEKFGIKVEE